jgi:hypothetical protein
LVGVPVLRLRKTFLLNIGPPLLAMPFLAIVTVVIPIMVLTSISNHKFILKTNYSSLPIEAGRSNPIRWEKQLGMGLCDIPT